MKADVEKIIREIELQIRDVPILDGLTICAWLVAQYLFLLDSTDEQAENFYDGQKAICIKLLQILRNKKDEKGEG